MESLDEPPRGSRDSGEDFIIVVRGEGKVSIDVMGSASSNHTATFCCLDRVIIASGLGSSFWGGFDPLFIGIEEFHGISKIGFL